MSLTGIFLTLALQAHAADLPNLVPGKYKLKEGTIDQCGEADFKTRDAGRLLDLSVYHIFSTENFTKKVDADIEPLKGCVYDMKNQKTVKDAMTVLNSTEVLSCGNEVRHELAKTALITKSRVTLDVSQRGSADADDLEPTFSYRCVWDLEPPSAKKK